MKPVHMVAMEMTYEYRLYAIRVIAIGEQSVDNGGTRIKNIDIIAAFKQNTLLATFLLRRAEARSQEPNFHTHSPLFCHYTKKANKGQAIKLVLYITFQDPQVPS